MGFISLSLTYNVFRVYIQGRVYRRILVYIHRCTPMYTGVYVTAHLRQGKISMVWELRLIRSLWDALSENK
jgi:hypothetical protein